MKDRIIIQFLLGTIIQLISYLALLYLAKITLYFITDDPYILISDYVIQLSTIILAIIISVQNLLTALVNKRWFTWTGVISVLTIYLIGWGEDRGPWPEKTAIFLIVGFIVIIGKIKLDSTLKRLKNKKTAANIG